MHAKGIRWKLMYERQSFRVEGKARFFGNLPLGTVGEGVGLIEQHTAAAERSGIAIRYECPVVDLLRDARGAVTGVAWPGRRGARRSRRARSCWRAAASRRTRNGAPPISARTGMWRRCAARRTTPARSCRWRSTRARSRTATGAAATPSSGTRARRRAATARSPTVFSKQSYPIGIVVNRDAARFLDEGADFRNYTYAKYGAEILKQPGAIAWQLFDAKTAPLLRQDEYTAPGVSRHEAGSVRALAAQIGLNPDALETTVSAFNAAIQPGDFNPAIKDGVRTVGIAPPKSNWALPLDTPPYLAFAVTCGITFTFGGVKIDADARVLDRADRPIPGLHAAGELVGGLFYSNYPGGSGLANGAVFGRRAGDRSGGTQ